SARYARTGASRISDRAAGGNGKVTVDVVQAKPFRGTARADQRVQGDAKSSGVEVHSRAIGGSEGNGGNSEGADVRAGYSFPGGGRDVRSLNRIVRRASDAGAAGGKRGPGAGGVNRGAAQHQSGACADEPLAALEEQSATVVAAAAKQVNNIVRPIDISD